MCNNVFIATNKIVRNEIGKYEFRITIAETERAYSYSVIERNTDRCINELVNIHRLK